MFAAAARSERHRELIRAVVDDDAIRVMLPNVKVAAPGVQQARPSPNEALNPNPEPKPEPLTLNPDTNSNPEP